MYIKIGNNLFNAKKVLQINLDGRIIHVKLPKYSEHINFESREEAERVYLEVWKHWAKV